MAAQILGATANPVDFGSMFIPFVGEEGRAAELFAAGRTTAGYLRRGLVTSEQIARTGVPVPKLVSSVAQATVWQGMADVPKMYEAHVEGQPMPNVGLDVLGQAAFAGLLHGAGEGLKLLRPDTHDVMTKQAMNDFLQDRDTSAHQYIPMDEHVIQYQAMEHDRQLREQAANSVDVGQIKRDVVKEQGEYPIDAALHNRETGEVRTGSAHPFIEGYENSSESKWNADYHPDAPWLRGFVTDQGRFVERHEADQMTGSGGDFLTSEAMHSGTSDPDWLSHDERTLFDNLKEQYGHTDAEAINKVRDAREQRRQQRILSNPNVQREIEARRQGAIDKWVSDKKQELKNPVPREVQRAATEPLVPRDEVEHRNGDEDHLNRSLDEDIESLRGEPMKLPDVNPDHEKYQQLVESMKNMEPADKFKTSGEIEKLKNKYGGMVPPEKMPIPSAIDAAVECLLAEII
jgi:hypothetical protein